MDVIATLASTLTKSSVAAATAKVASTSLAEPFRQELLGIRGAIDDIKAMLESERVALLHDGFDFILQNDLEAARRSLTQAKNREPASPVVRCWLGLVLAAEGRDGAVRELTEAVAMNPFAVPIGFKDIMRLGNSPDPVRGLSGWTLQSRGSDVSFASLGAIDPILTRRTTDGYDQLTISRRDVSTGQVHWERFYWPSESVIFATPRFVVLSRKEKYVLLSVVDGKQVATMRAPYFRALFDPPYAGACRVDESNGQAYPVIRFRSPRHPLQVDPPTETVNIGDPFGWGIRLRASVEQSRWHDMFNRCTLELLPPT